MQKGVLAALAAAVIVALPARVADPISSEIGWSGEASAAARSGTLTIELALVADDGTQSIASWLRSSGDANDFTNRISNGQVDIVALLDDWEWEFIEREFAPSGATSSITSSIVAGFEDQRKRPPSAYDVILGSSTDANGDPFVIGELLVAKDSPGFYSGVAYIDFASQASAPSTSTTASATGTTSSAAPMGSSPVPPGAAAASSGGGSSDRYVIWPEAADLGETVAILLETQSEVDLYPDGAMLNPETSKFTIALTDLANPSGGTEIITPRAVFEAPAALGSLLVGSESDSWAGIVLIFDLPDPLVTIPTPTFPADFEVRVDYETYPVFDLKTLRAMAAGGTALANSDVESIRELGMRPMLRLRPSWEPSPPSGPPIGFDPTWVIGAIEFTLRFQEPAIGDIAYLSAVANGDALTALASAVELTAPPLGEKAWTISVVEPEGFSIPGKGCVTSGDCYAGRWSLLDLPLTKIPETLLEGSQIFSPSDFTIEDLRVLDVDGAQLNPTYAGETFFRLHAVDNLVDPAGAPSPTPISIWPPQAYAGDTFAVLFNTEADVDTNPEEALLDASIYNVVVRVKDPDNHEEAISPRAVIEAPAALASKKVGTSLESQTGVIAFFEVPDPWPNPSPTYTLPATFDVAVDYDGVPTLASPQIVLVGTNGAPTNFDPLAPLADLTLGPMLRLRPSWDPGAGPPVGFDPTWNIGGLEFDLHFDAAGAGDVTDVTAVGNGEAAASLAVADQLSDQGATKRWHISLVEPDGISIPYKGIASGEHYSGRWALVDLLLTTSGSTVSANEFTIHELKIYDPDGVQHSHTTTGNEFFHLVPEPSATIQLLSGLLGVWVLSRCRRRASAQRPL